MPLLKGFPSAKHLFNQAESLFHKARITHAPGKVLHALPAPVKAALHAVPTSEHLVKPPSTMVVASAAKAHLPSSPTSVALSTDDTGLVRLHLPKRAGSLPVWVDWFRKEGRNFLVADFPDAARAVGFVERALNKPAMKRLPGESHAPNSSVAPKVPNILWAVWRDSKDVDIEPGAPVLILVHGIFDRVFGAVFSPLLLWGNLLGRLQRHYNQRVYGFDHETLSVDPIQNARDLAARLPRNTPVDILCHSRGGLVVRTLLQHQELQAARAQLNIRNVIFMGAANEGSPLAEPKHLKDLLATFTAMFQDMALEERMAAHFNLLVEAVRVLLARAADLPGLAALQPDSDLILELSRATTLPVRYTFISANFDKAAKVATRIAESISDRVFVEPNDLVVPFKGMTQVGNVPPRQDPRDLTLNPNGSQGHVYHLNYLDSSNVREHITRFLGVP